MDFARDWFLLLKISETEFRSTATLSDSLCKMDCIGSVRSLIVPLED
jgi:hypothetical protein